MNIQTNENNEMLLLMNSNLDQFNKNQEANQQYVQLAPSTEQYVVQAHPTMDLESLGELLNGQPISFEDGELSMIQRDGQQYIVLPSVSMGQVLQTAEVMEPLTNEEVPMSTGYVPTTQYAVQTMETMSVNTVSPVEMDSSSTVVTTQNEQQDVPTSLPVKPKEAETAKQQTHDPVPTIPDSLDITRLIPSLYQNTSQPSAGQGTLQCILCPFAATNEIDLDDHMTEHRNQMTEELFKGCKESFSKKSPKKGKRGRKKKKTCKFIRTTQGAPVKRKGPFTCTICNQQIEKINAFRRHMKEHSNDKNYKCDQCPEMYNIKSNLVLHQAIHAEREEGGGYRCPACQRSFMRIASLKSHLPVHLVDETMICTECGDEFTLKSQLESHMAQHRRDLQKHLSDRTVMPTSEELEEVPADLWLGRRRKFQRNLPKCSFCNKEFQKECQLKRHVLIHTGERPFACNLCDKAFNQKSALQIHLMMHSGKKPYQCPHCPQLYVQRGNLRMHMARVHTKVDNSFRCAVCSCVFKKMGNLNAHITKFHADDQAAAAAAAAAAGSQPQEEDMLQNQQNLLSLLTEDMITASKDKGASKEDMDVIQQLLRSLDDGEPTTSDSLSVPTSENLLTSELDNDIVQQALQDSGVDNRSSQESNETTNSEVAQHTSQNLVEHNFARPDDFRANGTVIDNASAYTSVEGASEVQPGNGERSLVPSKPRRSVISGVYLRGSGKTAGDQPWKVRNVDGTRWHQCMYCPKEFKKPSDLIRHIRTHTQERPFKCPTCQKSFSVKTSLTAHEKTHAGYKAFKCQICLKSFSTSGSLKVHLRLHTGARPFKCTMCDMSFRTTGHRHNHTMSHLRGRAHKRPHRREKKDLIQLFATNQSNQQTPLQQPIMLVTSEQNGAPSTQPVPAAPAASADEDSEERTHKCITCNKMFKKSCHLKQHLRTHTGEKPYSCTQCGGAFVSPSVLKAHLATHTGVKPFQCLICGQSFSSNNTLKRHMTIHSDARPYMCPYCQKTFKTSPTCKKHIETHRADVTNALQKQAAKEAEMVQEAPAESFATDSIDGDVLFELNDMQEEIRTEEVRSYPDDVMMGGEDAMEFHNNPALQQVNPNAIQNINKLPQFRVNNEDQESSIGPEHIITLVEPAEVTQQSDSVEGMQQHSGITGKVPALFRCTGCSRYFGSQDELTKHNQEERHAPSRSLLCSKCCHCLESQDSLVSHMLAHDSSKRLACPDCSVYFSSEVSLSQHREHHVTLAQRTCAVCDLVFNDHEELKDHVMRHPEDEVREAYRKRDSTVKRGKRKRTGFYLLSDEQSEILERTDPQQNMTLSERILLKAVAEKDVVSNVQAGNQRGRFKEFEMDGPIHANACAYCPKSFRKPSDLTRHERTHTGLKPFKCNVCDKSFCVKSTLVCHQRSHLQRKIYRCHICDMLYSTQSSLKVHMRLHTGAKPHKCPHCPMTFRTSGHRKNHMTVHLVYPNKSKVDRTPQKQQQVEIELPPQVQPPSSLPVSTQAVAMELSGVQSTIATSTQPTVVWPDVTLTLPMESFLNTSLFQDGGDVTSPQGQNLQLATDDPNITLQIDPKLLQQTIQESQQLQQQQQIQQQQQHNMQQQQPQQIQQQQNQQQQQQNQHLQLQAQPNQQQQLISNVTNQSGNWPAPNVVIQPINSLCVQPLSQSTQGDSVAPSSDEQQRSFPEINIAVPSSLAGITQQIFQSPVVLSDGGNLTELSKASEPLSLNNPSLIQAMQQLLGNLPISGTSPNQPTTYKLHALDGNGNGPELTLTFNSTDLIPNQGQFALPTFSVNNDQILHLDSESSGLIQQVNNDLNNFVAPMSSVAVGQTGQSVIVTHPGSNITRTSVNQ